MTTAHRRPGRRDRCAVVITALAVEHEAVLDRLESTGQEEETERGTVYTVGTPRDVRGGWRVVTAEVESGSTAIGLQLDRAVGRFSPDVVLFVGVAGGRKAACRGDVVAANIAYEYEHGRSEEDRDRMRTRSYHSDYGLVQQAKRVAAEARWQRRGVSGTPTAYVEPVASGLKVIAHDRSAAARLVDETCGAAFAVDLESGGFLQGAWMNSSVPALVVRGVSDRLSDKTVDQDRHWQPAAAGNAAAFAVELLDRIGRTGSPDGRGPSRTESLRLRGDQGVFGPSSFGVG